MSWLSETVDTRNIHNHSHFLCLHFFFKKSENVFPRVSNAEKHNNIYNDVLHKQVVLTLNYTIRLPIWNTRKDTIHASIVVYPAAKAAHFQLPDSCLMAAMVAIHGK